MSGSWRARVLGALIVALSLAAPARAAWWKAETDRFVVNGEGSEGSVRAYAVKLETYDRVLRLYHPETLDRKTPTKVQLYMLRRRADFEALNPGIPKTVDGLYTARNEGVFAFTLDNGQSDDDVLFHEYAHHFMWENFPAAYPAWFVEGFAEYFAPTSIDFRGIKVGGYNPGRVYSIFQQTWVPMEDLLSKSAWELPERQQGPFYAQAWLLTHYMRSDPARAKQLDAALLAINAGVPPVKAFQDATGQSLDQLTKALHGYAKLPTVTIKGLKSEPTVVVTRLPESADDLLIDNLRLIVARRAPARPDTELLDEVRKRAARYPADKFAQSTLARAEFAYGDTAAGEAIVNRLIEANPQDEELLVLAGMGQLMAGSRDRAHRLDRYRAARPLFAKAYQLDKTDFRPLYAYLLSRSVEPVFPTDNDLNTALEARRLAPAVQELSVRAGMMLLRKGRRDDAAKVLARVVNNPHGGRAAAQAKALLEGKSPEQAEAEGEKAKETPPAPQPADPPAPAPKSANP